MNSTSQFTRAARVLMIAAAMGLTSSVWSASENTVSPQVGASLKAGSERLTERDYPAALKLLKDGLQAQNLTDFEKFSYHRLMVGAAFGAGEFEAASSSAETVLNSQFLDVAEKPSMLQTQFNALLQLKDYDKAHAVLEQLLTYDPANAQMMQMRTKVAYFGQKYQQAVDSANVEIQLAQGAGTAPSEDTLKILADSASQMGDEEGYVRGLKYLTRYYPTADYWSDLLYRMQEQGAFKHSGDLHFYRLLSAADAWKDSGEFIDAAEAFIKAGFPLEAQSVLKAGKSKGMLPTPELARIYKEKTAQVEGLVIQDLAALKSSASLSNASPSALVPNGYNLVLAGDSTAGLGMIEQGLPKAGQSESVARLVYAEAALKAGQADLAIKQLELIQSDPQMQVIAELWLIIAAN